MRSSAVLRQTWQTVIGLELHVQFQANQKLFSRPSLFPRRLQELQRRPQSDRPDVSNGLLRARTIGSRTNWDDEANTNVALFDVGYPGTLPVRPVL
jgi:hypothetical protein